MKTLVYHNEDGKVDHVSGETWEDVLHQLSKEQQRLVIAGLQKAEEKHPNTDDLPDEISISFSMPLRIRALRIRTEAYEAALAMAKERCGDGHERRCTEQAVEETGEFLSAIARRLKGSRGTTPEDILKEGADVFICIVALMEAIGFSDEDIQQALADKSAKWLANEKMLAMRTDP